MNQIRILDYNIWSGLTYLGVFHMGHYGDAAFIQRRMKLAVELIRRLSPDVVCLHELNTAPEVPRTFARELGMQCYFRTHLSGIRLGPVGIPRNLIEADAILAKPELPFAPLGRFQLSGGYVGEHASFNTSDATQVIGVRLSVYGVPVLIFTTHWHAGVEPGPDISARAEEIMLKGEASKRDMEAALSMLGKNADMRLREARRTIEFIDRFHAADVILTGDFNSSADTQAHAVLKQAGFRDSFRECNPEDPGPTWNYAENVNHQRYYTEQDPDLYLRLNYTRLKMPHRLDYIFSRSRRMRATSSEIVMKDVVDGIQASDHFGVLTTFDVE